MYKKPLKIFKLFSSLKSQAALEFLTTYGWAFLIILIMIGALAYFGVLNPTKLLPNRCVMSSEFQCIDFQVSSTANTIRLRLRNNLGSTITMTGVEIFTDQQVNISCASNPNNAMPSGNVSDILISTCAPTLSTAGYTVGQKGKILFSISYYPISSGSSYIKKASGEITATTT